MAIIYIGIGSNEGDRLSIFQDALLQLKRNLGIFMHNSSIYETEPWGFESSASFYNAVLQFETEHGPLEVLNILQFIEKQAGRKRSEEAVYENRTLDLDLLYYDDQQIDEANLIVPHPKISERNFVLLPLAEINPDWIDPKHEKTIQELIEVTEDKSEVKKLNLNFG
ncbi:MAG: 2-amino-4-hydroxy-6-hydroxymethyldihydropteridine diphosphokinase [Crocinitomicaceae bacterium]|nr:2-amino-4-hydroxy-6-hydroxymethyldihydropteridine diphosphokinase [Crocinitomicaceae bacterium]